MLRRPTANGPMRLPRSENIWPSMNAADVAQKDNGPVLRSGVDRRNPRRGEPPTTILSHGRNHCVRYRPSGAISLDIKRSWVRTSLPPCFLGWRGRVRLRCVRSGTLDAAFITSYRLTPSHTRAANVIPMGRDAIFLTVLFSRINYGH